LKYPVNAPCWCGSGVKFKLCHKNRESEASINPWQAEGQLVKKLKPAMCVVPLALKAECKGKIINAHTISKSANLKKISFNGQVYAFDASMHTLMETRGQLLAKLVGVNKASTFTGFCTHHDKTIFSEIEDKDIVFSDEQCFKLAYRTIGRETYLKKNSNELEPLMRAADKGQPVHIQQSIQLFADAYFQGIALGTKDSLYHKQLYDEVLMLNDYSTVRKLILEFERSPSVMASGSIFPEFDFQGRTLQKFGEITAKPLDMIAFNVIATRSGGAFVFSWLQSLSEKSTCAALAESLAAIPAKDITNAIIRFLFEYCENTFMSPVWWEKLPTSSRDALVKRMNYSARPNERFSNCLLDDNFHYDDWGLIKISS
jgi:hypothetical protein